LRHAEITAAHEAAVAAATKIHKEAVAAHEQRREAWLATDKVALVAAFEAARGATADAAAAAVDAHRLADMQRRTAESLSRCGTASDAAERAAESLALEAEARAEEAVRRLAEEGVQASAARIQTPLVSIAEACERVLRWQAEEAAKPPKVLSERARLLATHEAQLLQHSEHNRRCVYNDDCEGWRQARVAGWEGQRPYVGPAGEGAGCAAWVTVVSAN
jgi:hypothetical protein